MYKNYGKERCTSHSIGYKALYNLVLDDIQRQAKCLVSARGEYLEMIRKTVGAQTQAEIKRIKSEQKKTANRLADLDKILGKLYEDRALGKISEERYLQMSSNYETEYSELRKRAEELEQALQKYQ